MPLDWIHSLPFSEQERWCSDGLIQPSIFRELRWWSEAILLSLYYKGSFGAVPRVSHSSEADAALVPALRKHICLCRTYAAQLTGRLSNSLKWACLKHRLFQRDPISCSVYIFIFCNILIMSWVSVIRSPDSEWGAGVRGRTERETRRGGVFQSELWFF